ncbi:MAG: hypothetical protein HRT61_23330 [Ekhidna sp.]|nr:hypothetical protein [Ekhidna sp.]
MKSSYDRNRGDGIKFKYWADRVIDLCNGIEIEPPTHQELDKLYRKNFYYSEGLLYAQFKSTKRIWLQLNVKHQSGTHTENFNSSEEAREFFKKFPNLRELL